MSCKLWGSYLPFEYVNASDHKEKKWPLYHTTHTHTLTHKHPFSESFSDSAEADSAKTQEKHFQIQ